MAPKHLGTEVLLGGGEFIFPGLSARQMRQLTEAGELEQLQRIGSVPTAPEMALLFRIVLDVFQRNYTEMSKDFLEENVSVGGAMELLKMAFSESRMRRDGGPKATAP